MEKGYAGQIKNSENLYDLPVPLDCKYISARLEKYFDKSEYKIIWFRLESMKMIILNYKTDFYFESHKLFCSFIHSSQLMRPSCIFYFMLINEIIALLFHHISRQCYSSDSNPSSRESSVHDVAIEDTLKKTSLLRTLHSCFWVQFYSIGMLRLIADISAFAGPMLLKELVGFIENKSEDMKWGYIYALGLVMSSVVCK